MLFQGKEYSRKQAFEQTEKDHLKALPQERYEIKKSTLVTMMKSPHVCLREDKHYYSIPFRSALRDWRGQHLPEWGSVLLEYADILSFLIEMSKYELSDKCYKLIEILTKHNIKKGEKSLTLSLT
mgnify:CR=1 FL=1